MNPRTRRKRRQHKPELVTPYIRREISALHRFVDAVISALEEYVAGNPEGRKRIRRK